MDQMTRTQRERLSQCVKNGIVKELFDRDLITRDQFEALLINNVRTAISEDGQMPLA